MDLYNDPNNLFVGGFIGSPKMNFISTKITSKSTDKTEVCLMGSSKLGGYTEGVRDVNLAACVELIHSATLLHDDVIDQSKVRRGNKTPNHIWGNQSSILVGDYLLSRCFEMMVEDGNLEILKLLSSTSTKIAQVEVMQLQYKGEADLLEENYIKIINLKTAALFSAATRVGACLLSLKHI